MSMQEIEEKNRQYKEDEHLLSEVINKSVREKNNQLMEFAHRQKRELGTNLLTKSERAYYKAYVLS